MASTRSVIAMCTNYLSSDFLQAIELAAESLANVKFVQEKKLIQKYFDEISQDSGKYCFGVDDTLKALELGAVEMLIVWENLDITRYILRNGANGKYRGRPSVTLLTYFQRRSSSTPTRSRRRTARSSLTSPLGLKWSRRKSHNHFSSGLRRSTRSSALTLSSSQIAHKRERNS